MIQKIRSLIWLDYCMALFTDFNRLGILLSRHGFISASLIFPAAAALTDITAVYTASGQGRGYHIGLTYGTIILALVYFMISWFSASLVTTALDSVSEGTSLLRNYTIINMSFAFKIFVLPCVSLASVISFAPGAVFILAEAASYITGILCISYCIAAVHSISPGKSLLVVLLPRLLFHMITIVICICTIIFLVQFSLA